MKPIDEHDPAIVAFEYVRIEWMIFYNGILSYLRGLDGDLSRRVGRVVQTIIDAEKNGKTDHMDRLTIDTARLLFNNTELWHEIANSRKRKK